MTGHCLHLAGLHFAPCRIGQWPASQIMHGGRISCCMPFLSVRVIRPRDMILAKGLRLASPRAERIACLSGNTALSNVGGSNHNGRDLHLHLDWLQQTCMSPANRAFPLLCSPPLDSASRISSFLGSSAILAITASARTAGESPVHQILLQRLSKRQLDLESSFHVLPQGIACMSCSSETNLQGPLNAFVYSRAVEIFSIHLGKRLSEST